MGSQPQNWYEQGESVFLLDYTQFGSRLRFYAADCMARSITALQAHEKGEELLFASAGVVQQLGHAYEDLAAVLGGLTCRYSPKVTFDGKPKGPDPSIAENSLLYMFLHYKGTLSLDAVTSGLDAKAIAAQCGFADLAPQTLPQEFVPGSPAWMLEGIAQYVATRATAVAPDIHMPFLKLKHGSLIVSDTKILAAKGIPAGHIGMWVPGTSTAMPKVVALPATPTFVAEVVAEIDRVSVAINLLVALYLHRHFPAVFGAGHVSFAQMIDARALDCVKGPCLIGMHLNLGAIIKAPTL